MAYVDHPIIGTICSKGLCSRWALMPHYITPASFLVYLTTHPVLRPSQKLNPNSTLASMLTISCFIHQIQSRRTYSRYYSKNTSKSILWKILTIFLGTAFTWLQHKDRNISIHLCHSSLTEFTDHFFLVQSTNKAPNMTPYCSGFPIDSIPPVDTLDPDLTCRRQFYQIIFGCINWLATCTCPGIAPVIDFLVSYSNYPHPQHYKAVVHAIEYLMSTNEYGILF